MSSLHWIDPHDDALQFPAVDSALREPDGLLAVGGDLSPPRLLAAYRRGIFPWYSEGQPILWWSPDPRAVLFPDRLRISRSLRKTLRSGRYHCTTDRAFRRVIERCAAPRPKQEGTWITPDMIEAYCRMFELGHAHSIETWRGEELVGGLYGIAIGRVFFGESMFSTAPDASKVALAALCRGLGPWRFELIDCQIRSAHLYRLGAEDLPRRAFIEHLAQWCDPPAPPGPWDVTIGAQDWREGAP